MDSRRTDPWPALVPLLLSVLMGSTSVASVVIALPSIQADLGVPDSLGVWIVDAYPLAMAVSLVPGARLGDHWGRRRVMMLGLALFAAGTACGLLAPDGGTLLASRIVMGFGEGFVIASVVATIGASFRPASRVIAYGAWTAAFGSGTAFGPLLGGALTEGPGWRSIWWVVLAAAVLALVLTRWLVPESSAPTTPHWDALSVVLCALSLGGLSYAAHHVAGEPVIALPLGLAALGALLVFVRRQLRLSDPLIGVRLFADRAFSVAYLRIMVAMGASSGVIFILSQQLQRGGLSPTGAGLTLLPLAAAIAVGGVLAPFAAKLLRGASLPCFLLIQAGATAWLALTPGAPWAAQLLVGLASGVISTLGAAALFEHSRAEQAGQVGAIQEVAFALGAGWGIALAGVLLAAAGPEQATIPLIVMAGGLAGVTALEPLVRSARAAPARPDHKPTGPGPSVTKADHAPCQAGHG